MGRLVKVAGKLEAAINSIGSFRVAIYMSPRSASHRPREA